MKDQCPFCSSKKGTSGAFRSSEEYIFFLCGTESIGTTTFRSLKCCETEISLLKALMREMCEILTLIANADTCLNTNTGGDVLAIHPSYTRKPAKEILSRPQVRTIMEEG